LLSYSTGDRWLTRRYMGLTLAQLSIVAVPVSPFAALSEYFEPPLDLEWQQALADQRAEILRTQGIPHPREVERRELSLQLAIAPGDRIRRALDLAVTYDAALRKEDSLQALEVALATLAENPDQFRDEWIEPARSVVRNRLAVHAGLTGRWIDAWQGRYPGSPLVVALTAEWDAFAQREQAGERLYLFR
jgi:hypothetical protein